MKKYLAVVILVALVGIMAVPLVASAATSVNIAITATGSEVNISCNQTAWAVGTIHLSDVAYTSDNLLWGLFTNSGSEHCNIVCHGHNMTGGSGWTLDNTTPGSGVFVMRGSVAAVGDVGVCTSDNAFVSNLGEGATQTFGLVFYGPTVAVGNSAMTMASSGLLFTATITP